MTRRHCLRRFFISNARHNYPSAFSTPLLYFFNSNEFSFSSFRYTLCTGSNLKEVGRGKTTTSQTAMNKIPPQVPRVYYPLHLQKKKDAWNFGHFIGLQSRNHDWFLIKNSSTESPFNCNKRWQNKCTCEGGRACIPEDICSANIFSPAMTQSPCKQTQVLCLSSKWWKYSTFSRPNERVQPSPYKLCWH